MVDPTGYTALDLIGFTDKGDYNPLSTYNKNDLANYNGTKWRCKVDDTIGVTPSEGLTWTAFMVLPTDHTMDMIAPVETSPSANAYVTGKQLIFNEVLYDVIDDIAIGDTLEVGVNIDTSDTIVEKIEDANGAIAQNASDIDDIDDEISAICNVYGSKNICDVSNAPAVSNAISGVDANGIISFKDVSTPQWGTTWFGVMHLKAGVTYWLGTSDKNPLPYGRIGVSKYPDTPILNSATYAPDATFIGSDGQTAIYNDLIDTDLSYSLITSNADQTVYLYFCTDHNTAHQAFTRGIMALDDRIKDRTYVPYAPTNHDLAYVRDGWQENGAYNILPNNGTSNTVQGLPFTKNSDGTVTVGIGTATGDAYFALGATGTLSAILEVEKKYKLTGCPSGGGTDYYLYNGTSSDGVKDIGAGCEFTWSNSYNTGMYIYIKSGTVISSPLTFKPMITTDLNATYADYVPYAMTNRDLTEIKNATITASTNAVDLTYVYLRKIGKLVIVTGFMTFNSQVSTGVTLGTFSTDFAPIDSLVYPPIVQSGNTGVTRGVRMLTDGTITSGDFVIPAGTYTINSSYFTK